jgi:hypothetical protein
MAPVGAIIDHTCLTVGTHTYAQQVCGDPLMIRVTVIIDKTNSFLI